MKLLVVLLVVGLYECRSIEKRSESATGRRIIEKITDFDEAVAYDSNVLLGVGADTLEFLNRKYWDLSRKAADLSSALNDAKAKLAEAKKFGGEALIEAQANVMALKEVLKEFLEEEGEEAIKVIGEKAKDLSAAMTELQESMKKGAESVKNVLLNMKDSVWDSIYEYLDQYSDRKRRELKGFSDLTSAERGQWAEIIEELKQKLREKFGVQDPEEDYRVDPEVREKFKAVKKELLKVMEEKNGPIGGHEDLTDDEWRRKYQKVIDELKSKFRQRRQSEVLTNLDQFLRDEFAKLTNFLKRLLGRQEVLDARAFIQRKIQQAIEAAKAAKENFDLEELKSDIKIQLTNLRDQLKSIGERLNLEKIKSVVTENVNSALLAARKLKSEFEASQLKKDIESGLDQAGKYFNRFVNKFVDVNELEDQLSVLKDTLKTKVKAAVDEVRAHESDLKEVRDEVVEKITEALNSVQNKVQSIDLEQLRDSLIKMVNNIVNKVKDIDQEAVVEGFEKAKENAKEIGGRIHGSLAEIADKVKEKFSKRSMKGFYEMTPDERNQWDSLLVELRKVLAGRGGPQKRELKSFQQMSPEEREQWDSVLAELKKVLKEKFGVQDPSEGQRLSPAARLGLSQVRQELMNKYGQTGHEDLTDDEWREKYAKVIEELKAKFAGKQKRQEEEEEESWLVGLKPEERKKFEVINNRFTQILKEKYGIEKRSMKGFYEMTPEERNQWDSLLVELNKVLAARGRQTRALKSYNEMSAQERIQHEDLMAELKQKLREKFGVQDENEGLRPSMETRQKLKQVLKSIRKDQGYEDLTDDEWRVKFGRVIEELKAKLAGRQVRALKSYNEMSAEERAQHEALLAELRQKLQEKFGVRDENEGLRPSMETRQKLKHVLKSIRKDQGYEDLTDAEWREKFGRVIDELKAKFRGN